MSDSNGSVSVKQGAKSNQSPKANAVVVVSGKTKRSAPQRKGGIQQWNKTVTFGDLKAEANSFLASEDFSAANRQGVIKLMNILLSKALQNGGTEFVGGLTENDDGSVTIADPTRLRYL